MRPRLKATYNKEIISNLMSKLNIKNKHQVPKIDKIILKMCIYEFTSFPSIPVKVSINEYVEISKEYSSPNSSTFVNGVINNIYKNLLEKDLIKKNERGLQ